MYTLAAGWIISVAWLWIAEIKQHLFRQGVAPPGYAMNTLFFGLIPAACIALLVRIINRWAGPAPDDAMQRRVWWHAFLKSVVLTGLLLAIVRQLIHDCL